MIWHDDCAQLILLVDRHRVESRAAALAERPAGPVQFDPRIDLNTPFGRALQFHIEYLVDLAEHGGSHQSPAALATLRESVLGLLLTGQPHNLERGDQSSGASERCVARGVQAGAGCP